MKVRGFALASVFGLAGLAPQVFAQTSSFTLTSGGWTYAERQLTDPATGSGNGDADFINPQGVDNLFQNWWWYSADFTEREFALGNQVHFESTTSSARLVYTQDNGANMPNSLLFDLEYTLSALPGGTAALVQVAWKIHNLANVTQHVKFYSYSDFDLNNSAGNDTGVFIAPNQFQLTDANPAVFGGLIGSVSKLSGWEQDFFANTRGKLTDSDLDSLSNATSPLTGDLTQAFVWNIELAPNGSPNGADQMVGSLVKYVNNPVPEPATMAVLSLGLGMLIRKRRSLKK